MTYDDTNRGAIWGNDRKEKETQPDFKGNANVDGVEYWVSAWKRGPDDNPKGPSLRFSFTKKDEQPGAVAAPSAPPPSNVTEFGGKGSDDIPF